MSLVIKSHKELNSDTAPPCWWSNFTNWLVVNFRASSEIFWSTSSHCRGAGWVMLQNKKTRHTLYTQGLCYTQPTAARADYYCLLLLLTIYYWLLQLNNSYNLLNIYYWLLLINSVSCFFLLSLNPDWILFITAYYRLLLFNSVYRGLRLLITFFKPLFNSA